ncbi:pre-mRNA cleavage complex 2 protein Pcf11 [Nematostella vectensis]|nr:pre-mRNA cleavage complex 2 protein Pcf11 [Nematostella vectensis]
MGSEEEGAIEEYASSLADLTFNSKPLINVLTMLAEENGQYAASIVKLIEKRIQTVAQQYRLPSLYLLDSIIKNVGGDYLMLIAQSLVSVFVAVFAKGDEKVRKDLYKLRNTWPQYFSNKVLYELDVKVRGIDPGWPINAPAPPPSPSIHINPKFLMKTENLGPASHPIQVAPTPVVVDIQKNEHQQRLLELQRLQEEQLRLTELEIQEHQLKKELILKKQEQERQKLLQQLRNEPSTSVLAGITQTWTTTPVMTVAEPTRGSQDVVPSRDPRLRHKEQTPTRETNSTEEQKLTGEMKIELHPDRNRSVQLSSISSRGAIQGSPSPQEREQSRKESSVQKDQPKSFHSQKTWNDRPRSSDVNTIRHSAHQKEFSKEEPVRRREELRQPVSDYPRVPGRSVHDRKRSRSSSPTDDRDRRPHPTRGGSSRQQERFRREGRRRSLEDNDRRLEGFGPSVDNKEGFRGRGFRGRGRGGYGNVVSRRENDKLNNKEFDGVKENRGGNIKNSRDSAQRERERESKDKPKLHFKKLDRDEKDLRPNTRNDSPPERHERSAGPVTRPGKRPSPVPQQNKEPPSKKPKPLLSAKELSEIRLHHGSTEPVDPASIPPLMGGGLPKQQRYESTGPQCDVPHELSLEHREVILKEAENRLTEGLISKDQYVELIDKLFEFYELQRQVEWEDKQILHQEHVPMEQEHEVVSPFGDIKIPARLDQPIQKVDPGHDMPSKGRGENLSVGKSNQKPREEPRVKVPSVEGSLNFEEEEAIGSPRIIPDLGEIRIPARLDQPVQRPERLPSLEGNSILGSPSSDVGNESLVPPGPDVQSHRTEHELAPKRRGEAVPVEEKGPAKRGRRQRGGRRRNYRKQGDDAMAQPRNPPEIDEPNIKKGLLGDKGQLAMDESSSQEVRRGSPHREEPIRRGGPLSEGHPMRADMPDDVLHREEQMRAGPSSDNHPMRGNTPVDLLHREEPMRRGVLVPEGHPVRGNKPAIDLPHREGLYGRGGPPHEGGPRQQGPRFYKEPPFEEGGSRRGGKNRRGRRRGGPPRRDGPYRDEPGFIDTPMGRGMHQRDMPPEWHPAGNPRRVDEGPYMHDGPPHINRHPFIEQGPVEIPISHSGPWQGDIDSHMVHADRHLHDHPDRHLHEHPDRHPHDHPDRLTHDRPGLIMGQDRHMADYREPHREPGGVHEGPFPHQPHPNGHQPMAFGHGRPRGDVPAHHGGPIPISDGPGGLQGPPLIPGSPHRGASPMPHEPPTPTRMEKKTVDDLFRKLCQAGIIKTVTQEVETPPRVATPPGQPPLPVPRPAPAHAPAEVPLTQLILQQMIEKSKEAATKIPEISLDPEDLKKRYSGIIMMLYEGTQCSSCGLRFPGEEAAMYREHLDWHFRRNRREKDGRRVAHRQWYIPVEDWLDYEEIMDPEDKAHSSFFDLERADEPDAQQATDSESCPVLASDTDAEASCSVCFEKFEQFWDESNEEWHYKDALRFEGKTYHKLCYLDSKLSVEEAELEVEEGEELQSPTLDEPNIKQEKVEEQLESVQSQEEAMDLDEKKTVVDQRALIESQAGNQVAMNVEVKQESNGNEEEERISKVEVKVEKVGEVEILEKNDKAILSGNSKTTTCNASDKNSSVITFTPSDEGSKVVPSVPSDSDSNVQSSKTVVSTVLEVESKNVSSTEESSKADVNITVGASTTNVSTSSDKSVTSQLLEDKIGSALPTESDKNGKSVIVIASDANDKTVHSPTPDEKIKELESLDGGSQKQTGSDVSTKMDTTSDLNVKIELNENLGIPDNKEACGIEQKL